MGNAHLSVGGMGRVAAAMAGVLAIGTGAMGQFGQCLDGPGETISGVRSFGQCVKKIVPFGGSPLPGFAVGAPRELGDKGVVRVYSAARALVYTIPCPYLDMYSNYGQSMASDARGYGWDFPVLAVGAPGANSAIGGVDLIDLVGGESIGQIPGSGLGYGYCVVNMMFPTVPGQTVPPSPSLVIGTESGRYVHFFHIGADQPYVLTNSPYDNQGFGRAIIPFGDVNGDGVPDVAIGAERNINGSAVFAGAAFIYSGTDVFPGAPPSPVPLRTMTSNITGSRFGHVLVDMGDVNGDGIDDLAVSTQPCLLTGSPCSSGIGPPNGTGVVRFFSGSTGAFLCEFAVPTARRLGESLALVHDVDGDGHNDVAVGAMGDNQTRGVVYIVSPVDGHIINTIHGGSVGSSFGASVEPYIDLTGDGKAELLVGAPALDNTGAAKVHILGDLFTPPPVIAQSPPSPCLGSAATLTASTTMTGTLRYKWFVAAPATAGMVAVANGPTGRGSTYSGADTAALTVSGLAAGDNGAVYSCVVTPENAVGAAVCLRSVMSAPTAMAFHDYQPVFDQQPPASATLCLSGPELTLSASASQPGGCHAIEYIWVCQVHGYPLPHSPYIVDNGPNDPFLGSIGFTASGATTGTLTLSAPTHPGAGVSGLDFYCWAFGDSDRISSAAWVTAAGAPTITQQPTDVQMCGSGEAVVSVQATAACNAPTAYVWQYHINGGSATEWFPIEEGLNLHPTLFETLLYATNAATRSVTIEGAGSTMFSPGIRLRCVLSNAAGSTTSGEAAVLAVAGPPVFAVDPNPAPGCIGSTAVMSSLAVSSTSFVYGWRRQISPGVYAPVVNGPNAAGSVISGATTATLTISNLHASDTGVYQATATNMCGTAYSTPGTLVMGCRADYNCSGTLEVADIFAFLNDWFAGNPNADVNGVPGLQVADIFFFLNLWFAGARSEERPEGVWEEKGCGEVVGRSHA